MIPRFATVGIESTENHTDNARLAATIYAFDVPLDPSQPWSVISGDGIKGTRVVWHFAPRRDGNQPSEIAKRWYDGAWQAKNYDNPLTVCRRTFDEYSRMVAAIKAGRGYPSIPHARVTIHTTRIAAALVALGHQLDGWHASDYGTAWKFHEAAANDAALLERDDLYEKLPDSPISYARGAILGHAFMVDHIKSVTTTRHEHRGRVALIGRNCPDSHILTLEKLLYRK
jgi:hypothetical protein